MPDLVTHHYFGREVYQELDENLKRNIDLDVYDFATAGPDPFFFVSFLSRKKNKSYLEFGGYMHRHQTSQFLKTLIMETKTYPKLKSYLYGFLTHYFLDTYAHPYIFHFTGNYDVENDESIIYRGLHTKLERAIDCYIIKNYYHKNPYHFKIYKHILKLKKLHSDFQEPLDKVYDEVYGMKNGYVLVNKSIKDQRKFYHFIFDRWGIKNKLFSILDNGKSSLDFTVLSYYGKEIDDVDIFNLKQRLWTNPQDHNITSNDSFFNLVEKAKRKAIDTIKVVENYVNGENVDLDSYIMDISYITGLPCSDNRPLQYFRNIFEN